MNWINPTATFTAILRSAILLCAPFLFVNNGWADTEESEELIVEKDVSVTLDDPH